MANKAYKAYKAVPTAEKADRGRKCAAEIERRGHAQAIPYIRTIMRSMAVPEDESAEELEARLVREQRVRNALLGRPNAVAWPIIMELEAKLGL